MIYYICSYSDYTDLPDKLFCGHTPSNNERKSLDELKFVSRCKDHEPTEGCLSWMNGSEPTFTHTEILAEVAKDEWSIAD